MDVINTNKVLQHFLKKPIRQVYKRILVEMSQKYTLECTRKEAKNEKIKITLNRCHVGLRRADIIDKILDEHPNETNVHTLLQKVLEYHLREDVQVVFACQTCNKKLEQEVPVIRII